jgi:RNA polymerase sigma-70 factor (ECF subfamily)
VKNNDELYEEARAICGAALRRLAKGYEADPERRQDLLQEIHIQLWRSLRLFDGRCSLQTWVYRVAHNVASSHILRMRRASSRLIDLDALETEPGFIDGESQANQQFLVSRLLDGIHQLKPLDRQVILLYLEGEQAASIGEVTGLSATNVATKIHRIKRLLNRKSGQGGIHARE